MSFDYTAQAAGTARLWAEMQAGHDLPARARIDLSFLPGDGADAVEFLGWLEDHGYEVEHLEADPDEGLEEAIEAQTAMVDLTLDAVQHHERRCTEAALTHGWIPDGWGFLTV